MPDSRAQARERQRRCRELRAAGLRVVHLAVDESVAAEIGRRELLDHPEVEQLVTGVLAAICVTRDVSALRRDIMATVHHHLRER